MKILIGLFLCLVLAGCASEVNNSNINSPSTNFNKALSNYSDVSPGNFHDLSNTPEVRITTIEKAKESFAANGIQIRINKHDTKVLLVKSGSLSKDQISDQLKNSLTAFRSLGIDKIVIVDKSGEKQNLDLTKKI